VVHYLSAVCITTGTVSGSHGYDDDGVYTVTGCVTDDDQATTCDTFTVTVHNVAPAFDDSVFLGSAVTFASGDDAFLGRKGVEQTHAAQASDIGSDDLRYDWAFTYDPDRLGGSLPPNPGTESTTTFNDSSAPGTLPFTDPAREEGAGSHPDETFPFTSSDTASVTFTGPGVYVVDLDVTDNGGTDSASLPKLVTDDCDCTEGLGFWKKEFKERSDKDNKKVEKGQLIDEPTLAAYLDIIRFASSHFDEAGVPLTTFIDAGKVLNPEKHRGSGSGKGSSRGPSDATNESATGSRKKKGDNTNEDESDSRTGTRGNIAKKREDALKHTLSAWLNFAKGAVEWDEDIVVEPGHTHSGTGSKAHKPRLVMPFNDVIAEIEAILNNPDATHDELVHAKDLAESINKHDKDNPDCTGKGSGTGTSSSPGSKNGDESQTASKSRDTKASTPGSKAKGKKGK
jgi:hypothetical protein